MAYSKYKQGHFPPLGVKTLNLFERVFLGDLCIQWFSGLQKAYQRFPALSKQVPSRLPKFCIQTDPEAEAFGSELQFGQGMATTAHTVLCLL